MVSKEERHCFDPMRERLIFCKLFFVFKLEYNLFVTKFKLFLRYFLCVFYVVFHTSNYLMTN